MKIFIIFLMPFVLSASEVVQGNPVRERIIMWSNAISGAYGILIFKENFDPVFYSFKTAEKKTLRSPIEIKNIHIDVELDPLEIAVKSVDFGYSINVSKKGSTVSPKQIKCVFLKRPDGSFAVSGILNGDKFPKNHESVEKITCEDVEGFIKARVIEVPSGEAEDKGLGGNGATPP